MPDEYTTHYKVLEIAETATDKEIKTAYRSLSQEYHPDKVPDHLSKLKQIAAEKFQRINEAYDVLSNPDKRRQYDLLMANRKGRQKSASNANKPKLKVSRTLFEFENVQTKYSVADRFTISNEGSEVLNGTITTNKNWLTVSQSNFNIRGKQDVEFDIDTSGLAFGFKYTGIIELQSNGGTERVNVTISVEPNIVAHKRRNKFTALGVGMSVVILIVVLVVSIIVGNLKQSSLDPNAKSSQIPQPDYDKIASEYKEMKEVTDPNLIAQLEALRISSLQPEKVTDPDLIAQLELRKKMYEESKIGQKATSHPDIDESSQVPIQSDIDKSIISYEKPSLPVTPALPDIKASNHHDAEAYYNRGLAYQEKGQYDRAIEDYNKAIALDPNYAAAYTNRGIIYFDKGQYDRAIENYDTAIALDPNDAYDYNNRGNAYQILGYMGRAISDFQKACDMGYENGCMNLQIALKKK